MPQGHTVHWLLERLMNGQDRTLSILGEVKARLDHGADRMDNHEDRITTLEASKTGSPDAPSRAERMVMRWASILVPLAAVLGTGTEKDILDIAKAVLLAVLK